MEPTNKTIRSDNNLLFQSADALPQLPILPQELIKTLFSELSSNDLQDAASATLIWNFETIEYVKQQRDNSFKTLINWLIVQIDSKVYANQLIALKTKLKESAILDSANLWDVKSSTVDFEMCLITILKSLSNDDLIELGKNFQEKNTDPLFENLFNLVQVYKEFENVKEKYPHEADKVPNLEVCFIDISKNLVKFGHLNQAIAILETIDDLNNKNEIIKSITNGLGERYKTLNEHNQYNSKQHYRDICKIMKCINDSFNNDDAATIQGGMCIPLSQQLFQNGQLKKAINLINNQDKDTILFCVAQKELRINPGNVAILEIVQEISDPEMKSVILARLNK